MDSDSSPVVSGFLAQRRCSWLICLASSRLMLPSRLRGIKLASLAAKCAGCIRYGSAAGIVATVSA